MTDQVNEEALSSIRLGETYVDEVTGFSGFATDKLESMHDIPHVCLDNESGISRWLPLSRILNTDGEPVIGVFTIEHAAGPSTVEAEAVH